MSSFFRSSASETPARYIAHDALGHPVQWECLNLHPNTNRCFYRGILWGFVQTRLRFRVRIYPICKCGSLQRQLRSRSSRICKCGSPRRRLCLIIRGRGDVYLLFVGALWDILTEYSIAIIFHRKNFYDDRYKFMIISTNLAALIILLLVVP